MLKRQRQEEHKSKVAGGGGDLALVGARSWIPSPAPEEKKEKKITKTDSSKAAVEGSSGGACL